MVKLSQVLAWLGGSVTGQVRNDPGGGALLESEAYHAPPGHEAPPLPGDKVIVAETQGTGRTVSIGAADVGTTIVAQPGEHRIYSRDSGGGVVCQFHIKTDGSFRLFNNAGFIELSPSGTVTINGATIPPGGDVVTQRGVSLDRHRHSQGADSDGDAEQDTGRGF